MRVEVPLPSLGEDANDVAELALWCVNVGDSIAEGEDLLEVTTDKAAFTLPAPKSGKVVERMVDEGASLRAGDIVCALEV